MNTPNSQTAGNDQAGRGTGPDWHGPGSADNGPHLPPLDSALYDRLNAQLEEAHADMSAEVLSLNALGVLVRQWRLRRGLTRQELAIQVAVNPTQLTCVEDGMAQVDDLPRDRLLALKTLASKDAGEPLAAAIEQHLIAFGS